MKRLLLIPALIGTMAVASDYNYEFTPVIGYNVQEGNLGLDDAMLYGGEFQYNRLDSILKPELSILYSENDIENSNLEAEILRIAVNGVYEYDQLGSITPLAKIGMGYETIDGTHNTPNSDGAFLDAGVGAKIALAKDIALKLEAIYMLKDGVKGSDNNFMTLAGLNFAFGPKAQPTPDPVPEAEPKPIVEPEPQVLDNDEDGVPNSEDACPTTPRGKKVDASGCCVDVDSDNDGVIDSKDKCPNTPAGQVVDADGCMLKVNLHINFKFDSFKVDAPSETNIAKFANFLKLKPDYSAEIIGHTDSMGSKAYNKKLSQNRAKAVKELIVQEGVESSRISTSGMGEEEPVATNKTREGRAQNRRIEATLKQN